VRKLILAGIGSTDGFMDMMQLVSLLLIPILRQEQEDRTTPPNPNNTVDDLLVYLVEMLLHDVTGSRQPKPLTSTLIRQIFQAYGEEALCENDDLVRSMLGQAGADNGGRVMLDAETFCKVLTADIQEYDIKSKDKLSTNYNDVMTGNDYAESLKETTAHTVGSKSNHTQRQNNITQRTDSTKAIREDAYDVPTVYTAPQVDNTADTFRSRPLVIFGWAFFVLSFQTYLIRVLNRETLHIIGCEYSKTATWLENSGAFFCTIGVDVLKWFIIMLAMSAVGLLYFGIGGIGNNIECVNPVHPLIGTAITVLCTLLPFLLFDPMTPEENSQQFLEIVTLALGICAALLTIWHCITLLPKARHWLQWCQCILVPEAVRTESYLKKSASYKLDAMVSNALEVHRVKKQETVVPTHFGQALLNFAETAPQYERVGGIRWTWKSMWNKSLFRHEGLLFSGRILSTNFIQLIITAFILIFGIAITRKAGDTFDATWGQLENVIGNIVVADLDEALADTITDVASSEFTVFLNNSTDLVCSDTTEDVPSCNDVVNISQCIPEDSTAVCTLLNYSNSEEVVNATVQRQLLNASGLNTFAIAEAASENLVLAVKNSFDFYFPTDKFMITAPLATGVGVAFLTAFFITVMVIPSASTTALKFRSGVLPFVHDPRVRLLRIAPDQTAFLRGVMFWGCLIASVLLGAATAIIVFLYLWQVSLNIPIVSIEE